MMLVSVGEFVSALAGSEILSGDELRRVEDFVRDQSELAQDLAEHLVEQRILTEFQARWLLRGKPLLLGHYLVLDILGQGGMGLVLKARDRGRGCDVALKFLASHFAQTEPRLRRFKREFDAASRLNHPNIVAAHEHGIADGAHFIAMEYLEGRDLKSLVEADGPLSLHLALQCVLQAARGLEYAHAQGVIHRDVKPDNLLLGPGGTVKVLDMGLARLDDELGSLTMTGAVMGTPDYLSPEQARNAKAADARSDIYSLGFVLWYLLTGRCPYPADSHLDKMFAHEHTPAPSLAAARKGIPKEVEAVYQKMVAKRPQDRFPSMTEVISALEGCLRSGQDASPRRSLLSRMNSLVSRSASVLAPPRESRPNSRMLTAPFSAPTARKVQSAWAARLGRPVIAKNSIGMELVVVPPGEFLMGSPDVNHHAMARERPPELVEIAEPFLLSKLEVTKEAFTKFVLQTRFVTEAEREAGGLFGFSTSKSKQDDPEPIYTWKHARWGPYDDDHPVINVTWTDAVLFCNWLSELEGLPPYYQIQLFRPRFLGPGLDQWINGDQTPRLHGDKVIVTLLSGPGYRLPTEAEWEYACGGGGSKSGSGSGSTQTAAPDTVAPVETINESRPFPAPVRSVLPNEFGLMGMHDQVWEWCQDDYEYPGQFEDSEFPRARSAARVVRGSSTGYKSPVRGGHGKSYRGDYLGFRVARGPIRQAGQP